MALADDDFDYDFLDKGDEDDDGILDADDLNYAYDDNRHGGSDADDDNHYSQDDDNELDFLNDDDASQDHGDDFGISGYADDDSYVLGEEPGDDSDGILDMGDDDWNDDESDSGADYDDGDVNVEETFNNDEPEDEQVRGEHHAPEVPDLPSMPRMHQSRQPEPTPKPEQHYDTQPVPPQAPVHTARHATTAHIVDSASSVDSGDTAHIGNSVDNAGNVGVVPRSRSGFAPEPLSEDLIAKIIVVYNDYMKMSDANKETLQQFLNIMYNDEDRQLEPSMVIKRVIEIDPAKRDALHSLLSAKRKSGSDRAFYLIGLSRVELNELYQMYLNSWNDAQDVAHGNDFVKGETIQEISRAAQWLNDAIEKYPTAMIPYIESSDKILQDAYHTMQS